jgi:hypothetical protein
MNKKRGYFIHGGDPVGGFAVVAISLQEARRLVYQAGEIEADWIDITGWWCRNVKVDDLPIGVVENLRTGLVSGIYSYLEEFKCDICGEVGCISEYKGQTLCMDCLREEERSNSVCKEKE